MGSLVCILCLPGQDAFFMCTIYIHISAPYITLRFASITHMVRHSRARIWTKQAFKPSHLLYTSKRSIGQQHSANSYFHQGADSSDIHTKSTSGINAKIAETNHADVNTTHLSQSHRTSCIPVWTPSSSATAGCRCCCDSSSEGYCWARATGG
jgi:hypothetical protein